MGKQLIFMSSQQRRLPPATNFQGRAIIEYSFSACMYMHIYDTLKPLNLSLLVAKKIGIQPSLVSKLNSSNKRTRLQISPKVVSFKKKLFQSLRWFQTIPKSNSNLLKKLSTLQNGFFSAITPPKTSIEKWAVE